MASILSSRPEISDVVLYEELKEFGHCRQNVTVNVTAAFQIGTVIDNDGDGTYSGVANADVATLNADVGIVIDDAVYDGTTGDRVITCMLLKKGGQAGLKDIGLAYLDAVTAPNKAIVEAALEAKGFNVVTTV